MVKDSNKSNNKYEERKIIKKPIRVKGDKDILGEQREVIKGNKIQGTNKNTTPKQLLVNNTKKPRQDSKKGVSTGVGANQQSIYKDRGRVEGTNFDSESTKKLRIILDVSFKISLVVAVVFVIYLFFMVL